MVKMHITLSEGDLEELGRMSEQTGLPKSQLIREAVGTYLVANRRHALRRAMGDYAEKLGDHSAEITAETGGHVTERLLRETTW